MLWTSTPVSALFIPDVTQHHRKLDDTARVDASVMAGRPEAVQPLRLLRLAAVHRSMAEMQGRRG